MRYTTWWTSPASWSRSLTRCARSSRPEGYATGRGADERSRRAGDRSAHHVRGSMPPGFRFAREGALARPDDALFVWRDSAGRERLGTGRPHVRFHAIARASDQARGLLLVRPRQASATAAHSLPLSDPLQALGGSGVVSRA